MAKAIKDTKRTRFPEEAGPSAPGCRGFLRSGVNEAELNQARFQKPVEVPSCLTAKQYLDIVLNGSPD